jgi:regulator of protease activity HflC (stomatin/prohibitin superfamily)
MNMRIQQVLPRRDLWLLGSGIGLLLLGLFLKPFTIVGAGERGVVMYFGKVQDQVLDEGIHPIVPIVTNIRRLNVRVQKTDVEAAAASRDLQDVNTSVAVNWHIEPKKVNQVFQQIGDIDSIIPGIINPAVSEVVKASVSRRPVKDILQERVGLKNEIDTALKQRLQPYGILVMMFLWSTLPSQPSSTPRSKLNRLQSSKHSKQPLRHRKLNKKQKLRLTVPKGKLKPNACCVKR